MSGAAGDVTTVELLTPWGRGAVAVIEVCGPDAAERVERFFLASSPGAFAATPIGRILHGRWGAATGEEIVVCRRAPTIVEVQCHGGDAASERIIGDLLATGAVLAEEVQYRRPGETAIQAAARQALSLAPTQRAAAVLLDQYNGALDRAVHQILDQLAVGHRESAGAGIDELLAQAPLGLHLTMPWRVVIAGPPNAGKSSLLNALLGYQRAIVFSEPGTTRDIVAAQTAFDGWPIELSDTAGLRTAVDEIEAAGVERAQRRLTEADCALLVFDATAPKSAADLALIERHPRALIVHNKIDLLASPPNDGLCVSALTSAGLDELIGAIVRRLVPDPPGFDDAVPFTPQIIAVLRATHHELASGAIDAARTTLETLLT